MPLSSSYGNKRASSSFRDPAGFVVVEPNRALRVLSSYGAACFRQACANGLIAALTEHGFIPSTRLTDIEPDSMGGEPCGCVLEQQRIPFISYPYEWCFSGLKAAALRHLDVHICCLNHGFTLSDATAFNIQFLGTEPVFIDTGSFVPEVAGGIWIGYRQFCEQFLNPLLLHSAAGVSFNDVYRGRPAGLATADLVRLLNPLRRFLPRTFLHVTLQAWLGPDRDTRSTAKLAKPSLGGEKLKTILTDLRYWITELDVKAASVWSDYMVLRPYTDAQLAKKWEFVARWAQQWQSQVVLDLGANTGAAGHVAVQSGAACVVSLESDWASTDIAFRQARAERLPILPLVMDLTNLSPDQGWTQQEWAGFASRNTADTVLSLALLHHLSLSQGIPLERVVKWICGLGRHGIIEFVPPEDPMAAAIRARIKKAATPYSEDIFRTALERHARVLDMCQVTESGRKLFSYEVT